MTILETIDALAGHVKQLVGLQRPTTIPVFYGPGSPFEGHGVGHLVRHTNEEGHESYALERYPRGVDPEPQVAEHSFSHSFDDLDSLTEWVGEAISAGGERSLFVETPIFNRALVTCLDEHRPELGKVHATIDRHPAWRRWSEGAGRGEHIDLTHLELADLLVDNVEDLDDPTIASIVKAFRAAKTVEYDADLDEVGAIGLRTTWKGNSKADVSVPREFTASFPAFSGAWDPGAEPKFRAAFRLRLVPPKGEATAPTFRILWVNAREYELSAARALKARVVELAEGVPVYLGRADAKHFAIPQSLRGEG